MFVIKRTEVESTYFLSWSINKKWDRSLIFLTILVANLTYLLNLYQSLLMFVLIILSVFLHASLNLASMKTILGLLLFATLLDLGKLIDM